MKTEYGIQMYSLRDVTAKDLEGALATVAEMGYKYIEFAGFFGHSAESVKGMLDRNGLICSGTHTNWNELTSDRIVDTIRYHSKIGNKNIIIPGFDRKEETLEKMIEVINYAQPILRENGISLGYHNHSYEFLETPYGKIIHKELETRTAVDFEIDTFWAFNAKINPTDIMERLKDRIKVIHLKDGIPSADGTENGAVGKSIGEGEAPIERIRAKALALGALMVVESEGLDPTGPEEVRRCIKYLRTLDC